VQVGNCLLVLEFQFSSLSGSYLYVFSEWLCLGMNCAWFGHSEMLLH